MQEVALPSDKNNENNNENNSDKIKEKSNATESPDQHREKKEPEK